MNYIRITIENIDKEHICCAMSGKQSVAKNACFVCSSTISSSFLLRTS